MSATSDIGAARAERRRIATLALLLTPASLIIAIVVVIPVLWLCGLSFVVDGALSLDHYRRILTEPAYQSVFEQTLEVTATVTVLSVLLGYPLAYCISQLSRRAAAIALVLVIMPFWTAVLVRTYAWLVLLQRRGIINQTLIDLGWIEQPLRIVYNFTGTVIGILHVMLPFLVLPLYASMKAIDRDLMRSAAVLGAPPTYAFWTVFFPLSLPGLITGIMLVCILCLGFYVTPQILGGGKIIMVSMKIEQNITSYSDWGAASSLAVLLLAFVVLLYLALRLLARALGAGRVA